MRKRSSYRPRKTLRDPLGWVLTGLKPLADVGEATELKVKNHDALDLVRKGEGTKQTVDVLVAALNMAEALAIDGLGTDWRPEIALAQDALVSMAQRGQAHGNRFVFTAQELSAVRLVMEVHDLQLDNCSVAQLERGINFINQIQRSGKARKLMGAV